MVFFSEIKKYADENYVPVIRDGSAEVLYNYVKENAPQRILEIGTAVGYSGLIMLSAYSAARLVTLEHKAEYVKIALDNFEKHGAGYRVEVIEGNAGETLLGLDGKFDFIFMDGPKTKYPVYYETLINLLNTGGVLFVDNVFLGGRVRGETATPKGKETITEGVRKFLETVTADKRLETRVIDAGDGITVSKKL